MSYGYKVECFCIDGVIMIFNIFSGFVGSDEVGDFAPISESMFFESFEHEYFFIGCPLILKEREI